MSPVVVLDSLLRSAFNLYFGMKNGELSVTPKKKTPKKPRKLSITSKHVIITCLHKGNKPRYFFLYSLHNWFSRFKKSFG